MRRLLKGMPACSGQLCKEKFILFTVSLSTSAPQLYWGGGLGCSRSLLGRPGSALRIFFLGVWGDCMEECHCRMTWPSCLLLSLPLFPLPRSLLRRQNEIPRLTGGGTKQFQILPFPLPPTPVPESAVSGQPSCEHVCA